jgi:hypothetical protein
MQVLKMLDSLDMSQYKQAFSRKRVTGDILSMVDEDILRDDLNIATKHRVRLMRIVSGDVPVPDSKYVKFSR